MPRRRSQPPPESIFPPVAPPARRERRRGNVGMFGNQRARRRAPGQIVVRNTADGPLHATPPALLRQMTAAVEPDAALREPAIAANLEDVHPELVLLLDRFDGDVVFDPPVRNEN